MENGFRLPLQLDEHRGNSLSNLPWQNTKLSGYIEAGSQDISQEV